MKVALCFWGLCRSTDLTIQSIQDYIFKPLREAGIEYTVFLHTYTLYRKYSNTRANESPMFLKNTLWKLLEPCISKIENQDLIDPILEFEKYRTHGNPWSSDSGTDWETLNNHIRSLWSLKEVTYLWESSSDTYDRVIYLRPDVLFQTPLQLKWLYECKPNEIYIPNFHIYFGSNDRFAIGYPNTMKVYGNRYKSAYTYSLHYPLHSEAFLTYILENEKIQIHKIPIFFSRVRANGIQIIENI